MPSIYEYETYIFDCDGVILDSNKLKIDAMGLALKQVIENPTLVSQCVNYFSRNFGKSRFHHVEFFGRELLMLENEDFNTFSVEVLNSYSAMCAELYMKAELTPGIVDLLNSLSGSKYIASGSEELELNNIFEKRDLKRFFSNVYGSPTPKSKIVHDIVKNASSLGRCVMIGDAISDCKAALDNGISFVGYLPYSNVADELSTMCREHDFMTCSDWKALR
ncbi:HAD family hydrolase [Shewanella cyperi]|uniref:phosphoglycolate phosphatase n=1 Tax=Shewanella cyperi TaxID=2814292 RepID=A0A974XKX3_9GAMM|nr:HAD-IA family hydrolase [Shewanella cyperi]QSX28916.1 HAD family hydrolase [Shewanella cyperi]